ncbi:WD40 repeat protein [Saccharothrix tamanrassetensis]|uniref:WD40 repeat protein n=1 Tax=Saccharothrix tamanrassetensis TaxID=1051531 RepID=A0A841CMY9_9PSEU|nr:hypothetical protein [Saccharothrix tamanrassetensis]MBB5958293.1 WD40 repeat protein [Saccharothrix tamanrassetensis]
MQVNGTPVVHLEAEAAYGAVAYQSGRDTHLHYHGSAHSTHRVESGGKGDQCPYPGLAAFGPGEARWFFGRERAAADLISLLDRRLASGGAQVVVAPSGAGKSSLLRAGLLPRLRHRALPGSRTWPKALFTPTARPLHSLATQLAPLVGAEPAALATALRTDPGPWLARLRGRDADSRVLLVVDQFEELFTLCGDESERRAFVQLLSGLAEARDGADVLVVIGVRADFYATFAAYPALRSALQDSPLVLGPMSGSELREAIEYPARDLGLQVEPGLVELLLRDLGVTDGEVGYEAGRLPLLAHALRGVWHQRHGSTLTVDGYRVTGGIERAIARTADQVHAGLDEAAQQAARELFLRLVGVGDGTDDTRRRVRRDELLHTSAEPDAVLRALEAFTAQRLLTRQRDVVEITHEALIRAWPLLRKWLDKDRDGLLVHQRLADAAVGWHRNGRSPDALYRGVVLADAHAAAAKQHIVLTPLEQDFLAAGRRARQRGVRRRRKLVAGMAVVSVLALLSAVVAFRSADQAAQQQRYAQDQRLIAESRRLATQAQEFADYNPQASIVLALASWRTRQTPEARGALLGTQMGSFDGVTVLDEGRELTAVAVSKDGDLVALGGQAGRLWLLSAPSRQVIWTDEFPDRYVTAVEFGIDHTLAVTTVKRLPDGKPGDGGTVALWPDAKVKAEREEFDPEQGPLFDIAFSDNGALLATAGQQPGVRQWSTATANPYGEALQDRDAAAYTVAYRPCDECKELIAGGDGVIRRWDRFTGRSLESITWRNTAAVHAVGFSRGGKLLASGAADQVLRLWDGGGTALLDEVTGHNLLISDLAFAAGEPCDTGGNRPGCALLTNSLDLTTRVWMVRHDNTPAGPGVVTATEVAKFETQNSTSYHAAFVGDSYQVVASGTDGSARWWSTARRVVSSAAAVNDIDFTGDGESQIAVDAQGAVLSDYSTPSENGRFWRQRSQVFTSAAFSPSGDHVAVAGGANDVGVAAAGDRSLATEARRFVATDRSDEILRVAFGPDGTLFTGSREGLVKRWQITVAAERTTAEESASLTEPGAEVAHEKGLCGMAISHNRRYLATGSDGVGRLWDTSDNQPVGKPLAGHQGSVCGLAFNRDDTVLATAGFDNTVRLWDVPTGLPIGEPLLGHTGPVMSVAFSDDGKLASGSHDRTVRVWDASRPESPRHWATLTGHRDKINAVRFRPASDELHTGSDDHTLRMWQFDVDQVRQRACGLVAHVLASDEASKNLPELGTVQRQDVCA